MKGRIGELKSEKGHFKLNTDYGRIESRFNINFSRFNLLLNTDYGRIERLVWMVQ